jgi:hypothetical protein
MAMYATQKLTHSATLRQKKNSATGTDESLYLQHLNAFLISELQGPLQVLQQYSAQLEPFAWATDRTEILDA